MKKSSNVSLGIGEFFLAFAYLILGVLSIVLSQQGAIITAVLMLLSVVVMILAAISMLRNKNDALTVVVVILIGVFQLSIAIGVLFILLLIKRKPGNSAKIAKIWFLPVIVQLVLTAVSIISQRNALKFYPPVALIITIISWILPVAHVLILSKWLLRNLVTVDQSQNDVKEAKIAYYTDLLNNGTITKEEYDKYLQQIENDPNILESPSTLRGGYTSMGNGQRTPAGAIIAVIVIIGIIAWIVSDIVWGVGFLHLIFN